MAFRTNKTPVLQEKTASGSVASFSTILQKPLVNGEFTIQAYQEGTGDPAPDNVRNIVGFSAVNITHAHKNLISDVIDLRGKYLKDDGLPSGDSTFWDTSPFYPIKENTTYYLSCKNPPTSAATPRICFYDINKVLISVVNAMSNKTLTTPANTKFIRLSLNHASYDYQLEVGSTATAYEPYVTPTIYTIQLGQEVYGAEVDVVNGVAHVTHELVDISALSSINWNVQTTSNGTQFYRSFPRADRNKPMISNLLKYQNSWANYTFYIGVGTNITFRADLSSMTTAEQWKDFIANNQTYIVCGLVEPFDIQLTPTQIETLIGTNNIFCDTGDTSVVFNDLDLAKRGSFREVFKLP